MLTDMMLFLIVIVLVVGAFGIAAIVDAAFHLYHFVMDKINDGYKDD